MEKWQVRSDLAIEAVAQFMGESEGASKKGVRVTDKKIKGVVVTHIDVNEDGCKQIGKKPGRYVSLDTRAIISGDREALEDAMDVFGKELMSLLKHKGLKKNATCLVIGLGNEHITPDALGPKVVDEIVVTRHLYELTPDEVDTSYREVSALAPGVMGTTGIETYDVIESVVKKTNPDFLVVVDALASRSVSRVNRVIQMTDTGIAPGSGVGNKRKAVNSESLGIPVIAIGVPTVVDAVSITSDTVDMLLDYLARNGTDKMEALGEVGQMDENEKRQIISEVLTSGGYNLMVTPKDIDSEIQDLATLVSSGINQALHPSVPFH
ncbi:MAG: GPR endopeptidase [Turicibacter sp.]|nr:GPR endopeptidase [Turicibacter sp.]